MEKEKMVQKRKAIIRVLIIVDVMLIIIVASILIKDYYPELIRLLDKRKDTQLLTATFRNHGPRDIFLLILLTSLMGAIPGISNSIFCVFNGILFGSWLGFIMNVVANSLGNIIIAFVIKKVNLKNKTAKLGNVIQDLSRFNNKTIGLTLGYMIPIIPSFLVNYAALKLNINSRKRIFSTIIGVVPASFLYAFGGDFIFKGKSQNAVIVISCVMVLALLYYFIYRKHKQHEQLTR